MTYHGGNGLTTALRPTIAIVYSTNAEALQLQQRIFLSNRDYEREQPYFIRDIGIKRKEDKDHGPQNFHGATPMPKITWGIAVGETVA